MAGEDAANDRNGGTEARRGDRLFHLQRFLLGEQAAHVLRTLREDKRRAKESGEKSAEGSWAVEGDYWPTDGSWRPNPEIRTVVSTPQFSNAFSVLRDSFEEHPLTGG